MNLKIFKLVMLLLFFGCIDHDKKGFSENLNLSQTENKYYFDCGRSIKNKTKKFVDIDSVNIKNETRITGHEKYFESILPINIDKMYYSFSAEILFCSAVYTFENKSGQLSSYLFLYDDKGAFLDKICLSEKDESLPGQSFKIYSYFLDKTHFKRYKVINSIDSYKSEDYYTEFVDSIATTFLISDLKIQEISKDSIGHKILNINGNKKIIE